jgi:mRNA degradation ribonuclease J1/J2
MDNQEEEIQVEEATPELEETTTEETTEETQEEETVVIPKEKFKAMQKKAIAYDASKKAPQPITNSNSLSREEAILIAKGMEDEDLAQLNKIAKGADISLSEAQKDPLFVAYLEKREQEKKSEKARLGASKSANFENKAPDFDKPGLSEEEHKNLWKKSVGK